MLPMSNPRLLGDAELAPSYAAPLDGYAQRRCGVRLSGCAERGCRPSLD
jgi:hypothetical protein